MKSLVTLRARLVMLVFAAIIPLLAMALFNAWRNADKAVDRATDNLKFAASLVAANQLRVTESARQILTAIANAPGLLEGSPEDCHRYLKTLRERFPAYGNLGIIGHDGYFRCHSVVNASMPYAGDREFFKQALAGQHFVIGSYFIGRALGKPVVPFAVPVLDRQGKVAAVAFVTLNLEDLSKSVANSVLPLDSRVAIMDRKGNVLAVGPGKSELIGKPATIPLLRDAVGAMRTGVAEAPDSNGEQRIFAFLPVGDPADAAFFVTVSANRKEVLAPVQTQLVRVLLVLSLVASLGGLIAWRMASRAIVKPTRDILEAIQSLAKGELQARVPAGLMDEGGELSQVATGFNLMAESLQISHAALESELQRSRAVQAKLHDAQRLARIAYWQFDLATGRFRWSDKVCEVLGSGSAVLDGSYDGFMEVIHSSDRETFRVARDDALASGDALDTEFRVITGSGEVRWMHVFGRVHAHAAHETSSLRSGVVQDITERKLAGQALLDSEQRYAALFDGAPIPMWVFDMATKLFLAVNSAAQANYGYSLQEFLSMSVYDIRPEEDRRRLRLDIDADTLRNRGTWRHRRKDGSVFPVDIVAGRIQYAGQDARFIVALDISARVKAEHDVQEHLYTLQRAADAAQAITWHQTLEGTLQEIADQARGVIGAHQAWVSLKRDDLCQQGIRARSLSEKYDMAPDQTDPLQANAMEALICETSRPLRKTQAELEAHPRWPGRADSHPSVRGCLSVPLTGRDGANVGVLQLSDKYEGEFTQQDEYVAIELAHLASAAVENSRLLQEIGQLNASLEQKVVERTAALAHQEALFRALAEQAPEVIWTADSEGAVTYVNRTWTRLVGGTMENWTGIQWFSVMHPEDLPEVIANWKLGQATQSPFVGTRRVRAMDGSWHTMSYRGSPVFDEQGALSFWVGIDADITEIKAIETALRLSNQELEAFSYSVSHDLRSPLNTVDGFSRLLGKLLAEQNQGQVNEKVGHYLARIQAGVAQMGQLIEDLLSLAQVARTELRCEAVDLSALACTILQEWQTLQPERQVALEIEAGLQAQGDGRLIKVVLENMLGNAWKFTSHQATAEICVGQTLDPAGLPVFFVRDNGVGFDMAYADKLFLPFQRLHAVKEFAGTGIGLATVSRVVERHGGRIWADAKPGQGAAFFFTLPALLKAGAAT
ncbi:MAG: PAS domain S-box protein [Polaromonas sp.]